MDYRLALRPPGLVLGDTAEIQSCLSWCDTFVWEGRLRVREARLVAQLILSLIFYSGFISPPPPADLTFSPFKRRPSHKKRFGMLWERQTKRLMRVVSVHEYYFS